jgi:hypothetical protein
LRYKEEENMPATLDDIMQGIGDIKARLGIPTPPPEPVIKTQSATVRTADPTGQDAVARLTAEYSSFPNFRIVKSTVMPEVFYPGFYDVTIVFTT